jgi:superoxide dismutase, Fe-Mn family
MKRNSSQRRVAVVEGSQAHNTTARERTLTMYQQITPIPVRPWTLNGLSERLIVSHYENNSGGAVRTLNAVRSALAALETGTLGYRLPALKREELIALGSVTLHELYFGNLGGEGNKIPDLVRTVLEEHFGSIAA